MPNLALWVNEFRSSVLIEDLGVGLTYLVEYLGGLIEDTDCQGMGLPSSMQRLDFDANVLADQSPLQTRRVHSRQSVRY